MQLNAFCAALFYRGRHTIPYGFINQRSLLRVMKLIAVIMLGACLQVSATGFGQKVSLSEKNAPLEKVFRLIYQQTGYIFVYNQQQLETAGPVSLTLREVPLQEALDRCFSQQPFTYTIVGKNIVVTKKAAPARQEDTPADFFTPPPVAHDLRIHITDSTGAPLQGASVVVKGTKQGGQTGADGNITLAGLTGNETLVISYVGYETKEINVDDNTALSIVLKASTSPLDEMQVIAYGTTSRRLSTGNVSTIKGEDIARQPVNNILTALEGRVPGLFIQQLGGLAGNNVDVVVQGLNSLQNGNAPFYVIDGVPYSPEQLRSPAAPVIFTGNGNMSTMNFINPADIESVEILKDADATAIYGSRAANGAILITTKRGKAGKTKVDLSMQNGIGKVTRMIDLMNTAQYLSLRQESMKNDGMTPGPTDYDLNGIWDQNRYTDWQKVFIGGKSHYANYQGSVSGGTKNTQFLAGMGYMRETTVMPGDFNDAKVNVHFNLNHRSENQKFVFNLTTTYIRDINKLPSADLTGKIIIAPNAPALYNADGSLNWAPKPDNPASVTFDNPMKLLLRKYTAKTDNIIANSMLSYEILPGLQLKSSFGYNRTQTEEIILTPQAYYNPTITSNLRSIDYSNKYINSLIIEPQVTYTKNYTFGHIDVLLGSTFQQADNDLKAFQAKGFATDAQLVDIKAASSVRVTSTVQSAYRYNALFGRLNYRLQDRYILNLSARRDGSSRFGPENLFNNFYSVGGAWVFSEENFSKQLSFLSFGKLRISYGTTGNDQIGDYKFLNLYENFTSNVGTPYQGVVGALPTGHANPYLQWEETRKLNLGLDLGFINNRILLNVNYFRNRSSNQLLGSPLPWITGFGSVTTNLPATVQNTGWEFLIDATPAKAKDFNWKTSFNLTIPKNKLISFPGLAQSPLASSFVVGESIDLLKRYDFIGVDAQTGLFTFRKADGTVASAGLTADDRTAYINRGPTFYGGWSNSFTYKNIQLDVLLQGVKQIGSNFLYAEGAPGYISYNYPPYSLNFWRAAGDIADYQKVSYWSSEVGSAYSYAGSSNATFTDASYIRLKNISIAYNLPEKWLKKIGVDGCKISLQGQNLLTITNYIGRDPESRTTLNMPPLKVYSFGLQINL